MSTAPLPRALGTTTLLLPCDGSPDALLALRHAIAAFHRGDVQTIHLLNVQPPFSAYVARHVDRRVLDDFRRERAREALAEARQLLDDAAVSYCLHTEVGDTARCIVDAARRLRCDRIVVGTGRKSALVRAFENSLTSRLLESSPIPVEVICGAPASALQRVGVPAGVGVGMAWLLVGGT
ncbi:universal stress protein [Ramlibacter sp.]|uniref:universal stress protein n=1 Tax=Ramlibacter sp. TaxID=1917967 RepID=UPI003D0A68E2